jgi:poly(3-hydroxybutyrate) depolymerase
MDPTGGSEVNSDTREVAAMKSITKRRLVVGVGLCVGAAMLARYGLTGPALMAALACILASVWLARQFGLTGTADSADYELNLLARLDGPDPEIQRQADMEKELHIWHQSHGSRELS